MKQTEICVRMWYPERDWNKVMVAGGLSSGVRHCFAKKTGLVSSLLSVMLMTIQHNKKIFENIHIKILFVPLHFVSEYSLVAK